MQKPGACVGARGRKRVPLRDRLAASSTSAASESSSYHATKEDRFRQVQKIGEGTYGVVYKALDTHYGERTVALKRIRLDADSEEGIPATAIREITLLRELDHPNIIKLLDVVSEDKKLYMVFEYMDMDLRKYMDMQVGNMPIATIKSFAKQMAIAVNHCHVHRILHRDLKPHNFLLNRSGELKLADFGLSRHFTIPMRAYTHQVVTLWYRPPEILLGAKYYNTTLGNVGCIFAELFSRETLFPGDSEIDQLFRIFRALGTPKKEDWPEFDELPDSKPCFPKWAEESLSVLLPSMSPYPAAIELLKNMLIYNPDKRYTAKKVLESPFFA